MASSLNVNDLIINRSDRSGVEELSVTIHEYPANVPSSFTPARAAYSFAIDQRTEALCRLLMEETEDQCTHGPLYFEPLARALALSVLDTVRHQQSRKLRAAAAPPGVRRAVKCLEADFADDLSLDQLAAKAEMSRSHFALTFRQVTGYAPHQYLLLVRLNHARKLIAQGNPALSLAEIAAASGFCDQAHLNRHFRRFFGTTPAAFRSQQERF